MKLSSNIGIIMKKMTYADRATFYIDEFAPDINLRDFLVFVKDKYNLKNAINCPCGAGNYFSQFTSVFEECFFVDVEPKMIEKMASMLMNAKKKSAHALCADIRALPELNCESVFILDQGIQYICLKDFKNFMLNIQSSVKVVVIDIVDFNKPGKTSYFDASKPSDIFYFSKQFESEGETIERYNKQLFTHEGVAFEYMYKSMNEVIKSQFFLYHYNFERIFEVIRECTPFHIAHAFSSYLMHDYCGQSRCILVLERIENL